MKGIGLNCIVIDLFVTEKRRVENCMSESVLIDSIQIIISIIIRVRGSMYLKQISNEIKIKYIDLTEWVSCRYSVEGGGSQGLMKIFIEISSKSVRSHRKP